LIYWHFILLLYDILLGGVTCAAAIVFLNCVVGMLYNYNDYLC
jgi:hypothetical protein